MLGWLTVPVAVLVGYRSSPSFELIGDAEFLIQHNEQMRHLSNWWLMLSTDYFDATHGERIGYYRPFTKLSWLLETAVGGGASWVYNCVQVAWLALAALGVQRLAQLLGASCGWAVAAGLFFGLHPALVEPGCLVMARSDLVCGAGVIWSAVGWLEWQRSKSFGLWLHLLAGVIAFASKETALVLPLLVLAWAWASLDDAVPHRNAASAALRFRGVMRAVWPIAAVAAVYWVVRAVAIDAGRNPGLDFSPTRWLAMLGAYAKGLPPFPLESQIRNLSPDALASNDLLVSGSVALLVTLLLAWFAGRHFRLGVGLLVWASSSLALVILPARMRVPGSGEMIALADRWLLHVVAVTAIAFAIAGQLLLKERIRAWGAWAIIGAWALLAALAGPNVHAVYQSRDSFLALEDQDYLATPEQFRSNRERCTFTERALIRARLEGNIEVLQGLMQELEQHQCEMGTANQTALVASIEAGDMKAARRYADKVLAKGLRGRALRSLPWVGWALLATGDAKRAVLVLEEAHRLEANPCQVKPMLAQARANLGEYHEASRLFEEAFRCAGSGADPNWLLTATDLALRAGEKDRAVALLGELSKMQLPPALADVRGELERRIRSVTPE